MSEREKNSDAINRLWKAWDESKKGGDRDVQDLAVTALFSKVLQVIGKDSDKAAALGEFWITDMEKYDPKRSTFYRFLTARLGLRKIDTFYRDAGAHSQTQKDLESGEKKAGRAYNQSLDARAEDDENNSRTLLDQQAHVDEHPSEFDATLVSYLALMLSLPERLKGKACNDARINYFRMFYTDFTTGFLRGEKNYLPCIKHERDVFYAMKLPFLDFFMEKKCRTIPQIVNSRLKLYGEMVPGRPMEEADQPLKGDVYTAYLDAVEHCPVRASTISQQKTAYIKFLKEALC